MDKWPFWNTKLENVVYRHGWLCVPQYETVEREGAFFGGDVWFCSHPLCSTLNISVQPANIIYRGGMGGRKGHLFYCPWSQANMQGLHSASVWRCVWSTVHRSCRALNSLPHFWGDNAQPCMPAWARCTQRHIEAWHSVESLLFSHLRAKTSESCLWIQYSVPVYSDSM